MADQDRFVPDELGGAPESGGVEAEAIAEECEDREALTARQTADCAGADLASAYENEEDGGS